MTAEPVVVLEVPLKVFEVLEVLLERELRARGQSGGRGLKSWVHVTTTTQDDAQRHQNDASVTVAPLGTHTVQVSPMPLLANKREAARLLGCSTSTLDRLRAEGVIQPVRLGSSSKYRIEDLRVFVDSLPPGGGGFRRRIEQKSVSQERRLRPVAREHGKGGEGAALPGVRSEEANE